MGEFFIAPKTVVTLLYFWWVWDSMCMYRIVYLCDIYTDTVLVYIYEYLSMYIYIYIYKGAYIQSGHFVVGDHRSQGWRCSKVKRSHHNLTRPRSIWYFRIGGIRESGPAWCFFFWLSSSTLKDIQRRTSFFRNFGRNWWSGKKFHY